MKLSGLALATSISGTIACIILFVLLKLKINNFDTRPIILSFLRIFIAGLCMGVVCFLVWAKFAVLANNGLTKLLILVITILSGLISYIVFCFIFRVSEVQELWQWVVQREKGQLQ